MDQTAKQDSGEAAWLDAAHDLLTESGVEAIKVMTLAKRLGLTRTSFYWHFKDREELLDAMIVRWENTNTGNLVARCDAYAESIVEAMFNLFDCWLDERLSMVETEEDRRIVRADFARQIFAPERAAYVTIVTSRTGDLWIQDYQIVPRDPARQTVRTARRRSWSAR